MHSLSRRRASAALLGRWASSSSSAAAKPPVPGSSKDASEPESNRQSQEQVWKSSKVPSSQIARLLHYGNLAAGLGFGAAQEALRRSMGPQEAAAASPWMSEANVRRLVSSLSAMRGAALKLGQFMSIQDARVLPPALEELFVRLQNRADYMPLSQSSRVLAASLGSDWRSRLADFSAKPVAAASIGQVHQGILPDGSRVAIKVQFPGISKSIQSDLGNLKMLLAASALLPRGLYLDNTIKVMQRELLDECDYQREADCGRKFGQLLRDDPNFTVPEVIQDLTAGQVLTAQWMEGVALGKVQNQTQEWRDQVATNILRLALRELFEFRLMQTDPNWSNFLWNDKTQKVELIDFGASREYSVGFARGFRDLILAAISGDRQACIQHSRQIRYFTGEEDEDMIDAHVASMQAIAEPFQTEEYDFTNQSITDRVRSQIPVMLRKRLTPPPDETYSLNRKLSGSFLLCAKLGAKVRCRDVLDEVLDRSSKELGPHAK